MSNKELLLYIGTGCAYSHTVLDFLKQHNLEVPTKDVVLDRIAKGELSLLTGGNTQTPCLRIATNKFQQETPKIIEHLTQQLVKKT